MTVGDARIKLSRRERRKQIEREREEGEGEGEREQVSREGMKSVMPT